MQALGASRSSAMTASAPAGRLALHQCPAQRPACRRVAVRAMAEPTIKRPERPSAPALEDAARRAPEQPSQSQSVSTVSIDYQRRQAKAMQKYFRERSFEEQVEKSQFFGWTKGNEITNGRWVMFGFAVGLLTEFATGVDFPHQFGQILSYTGILDFE